MLSLALTLAMAASPATDAVVVAPPPPAPAPAAIQVVDDAAHVKALCQALLPPDRGYTAGDVVARGAAEADQTARREQALAGRYRVIVPARFLRFAPYDRDDGELRLSERTFLTAGEGALHVWPLSHRGLSVDADEATARRIVKAAADKTLALALTFTLPDDEEEAFCANAAGSDRFGLGVEPFAWEYLAGEAVLARGGEGGDRPLLTAAQGARPRVSVSDPYGPAGRDVRQAVEPALPELEGCYRRALQANPGVDGTLVAEIGAGAVRVAADSVQDEGLARCAVDVVSKVRFPAGAGRLHLPIHFLLEPPTADAR